MTEFISALAVLFCSVTYWAGGQEIPGFNRGFKWIRRFLLPTGLCAFLIVLGAVWWKAALSCTLLCGALHLGYGTSLFRAAFAGLMIGAPAWILSWPEFNWMMGFPFTYHTAYTAISRKFNRFKFAWVGLLTGIGIGIAYVTSV